MGRRIIDAGQRRGTGPRPTVLFRCGAKAGGASPSPTEARCEFAGIELWFQDILHGRFVNRPYMSKIPGSGELPGISAWDGE